MTNSIGAVHTGPLDFDIAAREAQVTGERPRIAPLAFEDISDEAKRLLMEIGKGGGDIAAAREAQIVGKDQRILDRPTARAASGEIALAQLSPSHVPPSVATMMRHPDLFHAQMKLSIQLLGSGAISRRERELVVLRIAWLCRAPYEWGEHVEIAKLCGVSADEVEHVTQGSSGPGWSDHERAILRAVEELLGDHSICDETWDTLARGWDEQQLIEFPVLVGVYHMIALQQNSFKVRLPEHNRGLRQR